jgi:hypothetical protein
MEQETPLSASNSRNGSLVYWADSTGRRNTFSHILVVFQRELSQVGA